MTSHTVTMSDGSVNPVEYRVDELARAAGTTVRNVRAYQDRGLLPPPKRVGRIALYSDAHLARLRLVAALLDRGYSLGNIGELLAGWERGQDLGALLGLEAVLGRDWSEDTPVLVTRRELEALLGGTPVDRSVLARAEEAGVLRAAGRGRYRVSNRRALEVGALLLAEGVPLPAMLDAARALRDDVDRVARRLVDLVATHVFEPLGEPLPPGEVPRLAAVVERLRPLALQVVDAELRRAIERQVRDRLGEHLGRVGQPLGEAP